MAIADQFGNAEPGCEPWTTYGQHQVWIGRYPTGQTPLYVQELRPQGLVECASADFLLHRVEAGQAYRVTHLFGFWHVSEADLLWFQFPRSAFTIYVALAGGFTNLPGDHSVVWYCGECAHEIYRRDMTAVGDPGELLTVAANPVVAAFNADVDLRRCPACGWEHPPAYPFTPYTPNGREAPEW